MGFSGGLFGRRKLAQEPISAGSLSPKLREYGVSMGAGVKGGVVKICGRGKKMCLSSFCVSELLNKVEIIPQILLLWEHLESEHFWT